MSVTTTSKGWHWSLHHTVKTSSLQEHFNGREQMLTMPWLGMCHSTLTSARPPRLGLCHSTSTPARTPRLGLCHNTLTPARTLRLGLCHSTLTSARTPRLGLCHSTSTSTRTPRLGLCHSTPTPAITLRLGLCHSTPTPAITLRLGLCHSTPTPAITLRLGLCHSTSTPAITLRLGLCHSTPTPAITLRLGLCHSTPTPAITLRLGLCHSTPTPAITLRLGLCHSTPTPARTPKLQWNAPHSYVGTILSVISSIHNSIHPPEMEIIPPNTACGCPCGRIQNKTNKQSSHTHNPLTLWNAFVKVQLYTPGDPQSVHLGNTTLTTTNANLPACSSISDSFLDTVLISTEDWWLTYWWSWLYSAFLHFWANSLRFSWWERQ